MRPDPDPAFKPVRVVGRSRALRVRRIDSGPCACFDRHGMIEPILDGEESLSAAIVSQVHPRTAVSAANPASYMARTDMAAA
jgi:hypothetical protein